MTKVDKIIIILAVLGFAVWFGGTVIRNAVAYDLFVPGTELIEKNWYPNDVQVHVVNLYGMTSFYTSIGYGLAALGVIWSLFSFRKQLRRRGWLFMGSIMFLLTLPVEAYLLYYDIRLNMAIGEGIEHFTNPAINEFFIYKFKALGIPSTLSFLAVLTSIVIFVWRPLEKKEAEIEA
jgi:hypothetical protein